MRKIILILSLFALLMFVFPAVASGSAPSFYENDGGSTAVQIAHSSPAFDASWPAIMSHQVGQLSQAEVQIGNILGRLVGMFVDKGPINH